MKHGQLLKLEDINLGLSVPEIFLEIFCPFINSRYSDGGWIILIILFNKSKLI